MNYASTLTNNQQFELLTVARAHRQTPETLLDFAIDRLSLPELDPEVRNALLDYIRAGGTWTGDDAQLRVKTAGVFHLLAGSGDFQFV
jgi:hypothetical protein